MPSGKSAQPLITDNQDGTVTVQYSPTEAGLHEMHIKYNGTHIPGQRTRTHIFESDLMTAVRKVDRRHLVSRSRTGACFALIHQSAVRMFGL